MKFNFKRIRNWFSNDPLLKILSIVLAIILWAYVTGRENTEENFEVRVEIYNVPAGLTVMGEMVSNVNVRVRGPKLRMQTLNQQSLKAYVDLANAGEGKQVIELKPENLVVPKYLKVLKIQPKELTVKLEKIKQ